MAGNREEASQVPTAWTMGSGLEQGSPSSFLKQSVPYLAGGTAPLWAPRSLLPSRKSIRETLGHRLADITHLDLIQFQVPQKQKDIGPQRVSLLSPQNTTRK